MFAHEGGGGGSTSVCKPGPTKGNYMVTLYALHMHPPLQHLPCKEIRIQIGMDGGESAGNGRIISPTQIGKRGIKNNRRETQVCVPKLH